MWSCLPLLKRHQSYACRSSFNSSTKLILFSGCPPLAPGNSQSISMPSNPCFLQNNTADRTKRVRNVLSEAIYKANLGEKWIHIFRSRVKPSMKKRFHLHLCTWCCPLTSHRSLSLLSNSSFVVSMQWPACTLRDHHLRPNPNMDLRLLYPNRSLFWQIDALRACINGGSRLPDRIHQILGDNSPMMQNNTQSFLKQLQKWCRRVWSGCQSLLFVLTFSGNIPEAHKYECNQNNSSDDVHARNRIQSKLSKWFNRNSGFLCSCFVVDTRLIRNSIAIVCFYYYAAPV